MQTNDVSTATQPANLGGSFLLPGTTLTVNRMGYGAMQLAGPGVYGPPRDPAAAVAVLRGALEAGVNHIDTSDFYGPHVTNQIIKEALHPYPEGLVIVTKVGGRRGEDKSWHPAISRQELVDAVHDNLRNLGLDALDVVNFRTWGSGHGPAEGSLEEPLSILAELKEQGLIRHLGLSNVTPTQVKDAQAITPVVCVQNMYNVAHREDDAFIDDLAHQGIAYVPFFPLGGFSPLQSSTLEDTAKSLGCDDDAGRPRVAATAFTEHPAHSRYVVGGSSAREPPSRRVVAVVAGGGRVGCYWRKSFVIGKARPR